MSHKYKLKYKLDMEVGEFTRKEMYDAFQEDNEVGATDALMFASMLYPEDGSLSVQFMGFDGRSGNLKQLEDIELFKVWQMLCHQLSNSKTLDEGQRHFTQGVFETIKEIVADSKNSKPDLHVVDNKDKL